MIRAAGLAILLGTAGCVGTKETLPKLTLPTVSEVEAAERADWGFRLDFFKRTKVLDQSATEVELVGIKNLMCQSMFDSWAECTFEMDVVSGGKVLPAGKIFGQYTPQGDGRWKSEIIVWHTRRN